MKIEKLSLTLNEKIGLISNLSTMLSAGISILEAVDSLLEDSKKNQQKLLNALRDGLIQGQQIHVSLAQFPRVFDKVTINLIKASEEAGTLDSTLKDLKENIKRESEFNDKIKSALTYPAVIFVVFLGVFLTILLVVIPKISTVFSRLRVELPLPTKIMIGLSNLVTQHTLLIIVSIFGSIGLVIFLFKTQRRLFISVLIRMPLVSQLVKVIDITRFTRNMHYLLNAGIPITSALELTEEVVTRRDVARLIHTSREMVSAGKRLSEGLKTSKSIMPSIVIKLIEAGEKSGTLDTSLADIAEYLDYQVTNTLRTLTALLEPIMLVLVGILIGGMMLAIIGPIYGLIGQVGNR